MAYDPNAYIYGTPEWKRRAALFDEVAGLIVCHLNECCGGHGRSGHDAFVAVQDHKSSGLTYRGRQWYWDKT